MLRSNFELLNKKKPNKSPRFFSCSLFARINIKNKLPSYRAAFLRFFPPYFFFLRYMYLHKEKTKKKKLGF